MYPPKVDDEDVLRVIRELTRDGKLPSGASVRQTLAQRHGSRGGVTRIYRLLQGERGRHPTSDSGWQRHQAYWTQAVTELLDTTSALANRVAHAASDLSVSAALVEESRAAEIKVGRLRTLIRAFGPAPEGMT